MNYINENNSLNIIKDLFNEIYYNYGWVCPKCGAVMSPSIPFCFFCSNNKEKGEINGKIQSKIKR